MVLVSLLNIILVLLLMLLVLLLLLLHTTALLQIVTLILQVAGLLSQLLHIRKHDLHIDVLLVAALSLIELLRDEGCIPLSGVRAIVPRVSAGGAVCRTRSVDIGAINHDHALVSMGARRRRAAAVAHLDYVANLLSLLLLLRVSCFVLEQIGSLVIA